MTLPSGTYKVTYEPQNGYPAWGSDWFTAVYDEDTHEWAVIDSVGKAKKAGWVTGIVKENIHRVYYQFTYTLIAERVGLWIEEIENV